ncbi:MAG: hypothetical protein NC209_03840 [Alistipes sp.]|nr:hypothetical protein [Alistipes sp.]
MIPEIKELNFPSYATLSQATCTLQDMAEKTITTRVKIDGAITPDFSYDWEIEFKGEKYIMPLRQPQAAKENTSLNSSIDLTFQHWAQYQLKRWYFFTIQPVESSTAVADKYIASVSLNLGDFCKLFAQILNYYYEDRITIDLNPEWKFTEEPVTVEISYSYLWDVLIQFYELWAVRWTIEPNGSTDKYVIKVGYPTAELSHIFEYGFNGGLLKVERQVQDDNIRNMLLGRGGEQNLPYRYFKDVDKNNDSFPADPDWIPELANIYFSELRGATFRSYIQGWKARHYNGKTTKDKAYAPWAWEKGYTDAKFDPVEYVKDDMSIAKYGELMGGLENNEEIYPSIQGVTVDPYGRIDEVVDVETVLTDNAEDIKHDIQTTGIQFISTNISIRENDRHKVTLTGKTFEISDGRTGNLTMDPHLFGGFDYDKAEIENPIIRVINAHTGEEHPTGGIPAGKWYYTLEMTIHNITNSRVEVTCGAWNIELTTWIQEERTGDTFDIWVKNIWETKKNAGETDTQYAERVWRPILGDRVGEEAKVVFSTGMLSTSEDYEFIITEIPEYDTRKTLNGVSSHWRIKLGKSDADLESTGFYLPSTMRQAAAGDHFFFIGIDMPHQYVVWAEERLDGYKTDNLDEVKDIKPTWVVSLDKVRINNKQQGEAQTLISQLRVGNSLRLADKRFIINNEGNTAAYETLYLQSIIYTYSEPTSSSPAFIPDVEVVLSNMYETSANPVATLQGTVSAIQKQLGSTSNIKQIVRAVGDNIYLRKDGIADRSMSPTDFFSPVKLFSQTTSGEFRAGIIGGAGWGLFQDSNGNWIFETDRINVRQDMQVNNLAINQITARGGMIVESAAQMEVTHVENTDDGYICFFDPKSGSIANLFQVDDVAYCNRFTPENAELKFYKRRVIAVSVDSITLTKGYDPVALPDGTTDTGVNGEGIPETGDVIIQFGNYTDTARQYAKVRDIIGGGYDRYLEKLDSVNAAGKEYYFVGKQDGQNPRWFIGYKDRNYAEWRDGNLYIKGNIDMTAGSTGLQNVTEFKNLEDKVDNIQIGGRNLLLNSGVEQQSSGYRFADYDLAESIESGQEVTLTFWGELDESVDYITPYNSGGYLALLSPDVARVYTRQIKETGKGSVTFNWRTETNLFNYTKASCQNTAKEDPYGFRQIEADDYPNLRWKIQGHTTSGEYLELEQVIFNDTGRHFINFTVPRNKDVDYCRFGLNGRTRDSLVLFWGLKPGDYTLSFYLTDNIQGQVLFDRIQIMSGYDDRSEWIASLLDRGYGTPSNDSLVMWAFNADGSPNLKNKTLYRAKLEYGNVPTAWSPAPEDLSADVDDLQFIKKIFPSGLIENTATISQLLAVKDSTNANANIVAGIYGGGVSELEANGFKDSAHGKLMIFAGASDVNNVKTAGTRIYEDGTIITSKLIATNAEITGNIDATSGTFGPLEFRAGKLSTTSTEYGARTTTIGGGGTWWEDKFSFNGEKHSYSVIIGNTWAYTGGENNPISITCDSTSETYSNIGIRLDVGGTIYNNSLSTAGNHAIFIDNGDISILKGRIRGFRLNTVRITYSQTIRIMDSILLVNSTSAITLTLPSAPEDGQLYFIKKINTGGITLKVGVTGHYINDGSISKKTSWSWTDGCFVIVVWDATNKIWQAGYTNNN